MQEGIFTDVLALFIGLDDGLSAPDSVLSNNMHLRNRHLTTGMPDMREKQILKLRSSLKWP